MITARFQPGDAVGQIGGKHAGGWRQHHAKLKKLAERRGRTIKAQRRAGAAQARRKGG
jgi:hypothetical protein